MNPRIYLRAGLGFALLIAGGIGVGLWIFSGDARPDPAVAPPIQVADPDRVRLVALGDVGEDSATQRHVRDAVGRVCAERGCDFAVMLGDNLYPRGLEAPDDPRMSEIVGDIYAPLKLPIYLVLGNHDYGSMLDRQKAAWQVAWAARTPGFEMPAPTWTAQAGPVGLWGLDSTEVFWAGGEPQAAWIDQTVRASSARWRVALAHHPLRSNGKHGNAGSYEGLPGVPIADGAALEKLYTERLCGRFDLLLTGHDHNLQWIEHCGLTQIVSGAASKVTPRVDRGNRTVFEHDGPGFAWIQLDPDHATIAFHGADGALLFEARRRRDGAIDQARTGG